MKALSKTYLLALLGAMLSACTTGGMQPESCEGSRLDMQIGMDITKAHFEDRDGTASFVWDAGVSMIAAVSNAGTLSQWEGGAWYSPMSIYLVDPDDAHFVKKATSLLTLPSSAAVSGDSLFCLSPVNGSSLCSVEASEERVSVQFSMPFTFEQSKSGALEEFGDYCFIRGESTIKSVPSATEKDFEANSTVFRSIPATFRFRVSNHTSSDVVLESVKITCDSLFPDKLCWQTDGRVSKVGECEDKSAYFHTVKTSIAGGLGEVIKAKDGEIISTGTYYSMCLPFDTEASMEGATLAFILEARDKIHTFNISAASFFRDASCKKFESNKIYTFNFSFHENSVELEGVSISDWVKDSWYVPTEEVSEFIIVSPSYWVQDRENLYTYAFIKMFGNATNYTLWSKCNIGEYLNFATDLTFSWREITPSDVSDTDYLAKFFDNIKDFKWKTPSSEDFRLLFTNSDVQMCKDSESEVFGLRMHSKDFSGSAIFLPVTEKIEEHTEYPGNGLTVITRTYSGKYWTRDKADDSTGYLMHFAFSQVETVETTETLEEISTFSEFFPALESGELFEIIPCLKTEYHQARAILEHNE